MKFGDKQGYAGGQSGYQSGVYACSRGRMDAVFLKKAACFSSIYYRRTTDKIERMSEVGSDGIIYTVPMNIASRDAGGIELNATYNPVNWLKIHIRVQFFIKR
ncbi:MAG: outer membrane beta-barrel family protein [Taibaiella sp.]|nr:outer membrane beta-barrel family protein [Taibaiella sp.]